jgi:hypothetical protein
MAGRIPAEVFLFQDVHPESICHPYFGMHMAADSFFDFPSSAHNRAGVVSNLGTRLDPSIASQFRLSFVRAVMAVTRMNNE